MEMEQLVNTITAEVVKKFEEVNAPASDRKPEYNEKFGKYCDHTVLRAYTPQNIVKGGGGRGGGGVLR